MWSPNQTERKGPLSAEQVAAFVNDGFLVLPGLVTPTELADLKCDTARIARGQYPTKAIEPLPPETTDEQALSRILCIHQPHQVSPVMKRFALHPQISSMLAQITAAHLPFWDGSVKSRLDQFRDAVLA